MIEAELIVAGIQWLLRVGRAANQSLIQYEIEAAIFVPGLKPTSPASKLALIKIAFAAEDQIGRLTGPEFRDYWDDEHTQPNPEQPEAEEILYLAAVDILVQRVGREQGIPADRARGSAGAQLLKQWSDDEASKRPVKPLPRFLLALADASLEVVGENPSLLGIGGSGEQLIGALAANLSALIPDDADEFGPQSQFADRLLRLFLRASLQTLSDRSDVVIPKQHLAQLTKNFLGPVIQALPQDFLEQASWHQVADALTGPAARAAFETVAAHPDAFLGREFDPNNAIGAVTQALFAEASRLGLGEVFSEAGAIQLYKAALGVAAERPELFAPRGAGGTQEIATALIGTLAKTLQAAPSPFDDDLGVELAVAALGVFAEHGSKVLPADQPWEQLVSAIVLQVAGSLHEGLGKPDRSALAGLFSRAQLTRFARIFVEAAAQNPEWLTGNRPELANVVRAVAGARLKDDRDLLSPDAWAAVALEAVTEAAANPGRLFPIAGSDPGLGGALLADLISVASEDASGGRAKGGVLFGETLLAAARILLRSAASQSDAASANRTAIVALARALCVLARSQPGQVSSSEWLALYRTLLPRALAGEAVAELPPERLIALLSGGVRP